MGGPVGAHRGRWPSAGVRAAAADDRRHRAPAGAWRVLDSWPGRRAPAHRGDGVSADAARGSDRRRRRHLLGSGAVVRVRLWGTRGSVAAPGNDTVRYGGNTSCVEVRGGDGTLLVLDAGTGIRPLGRALGTAPPRLHVLLSHFHMDHIQGLGFFAPLFAPEVET